MNHQTYQPKILHLRFVVCHTSGLEHTLVAVGRPLPAHHAKSAKQSDQCQIELP